MRFVATWVTTSAPERVIGWNRMGRDGMRGRCDLRGDQRSEELLDRGGYIGGEEIKVCSAEEAVTHDITQHSMTHHIAEHDITSNHTIQHNIA